VGNIQFTSLFKNIRIKSDAISRGVAAYGKTYNDLINDFLVPLGKPLMSNLATAHGFYKAAIPIGATVNMNTFNRTLTVMEPAVSPVIAPDR